MTKNSKYHHTQKQLLDERVLIERAQKNIRYFEPLYHKYYEQIFRYCYQRMDSESSAEDVTSQVFLKAITNIKKYQYKGVPFGSWLYRIAMSEVHKAYKQDRAKQTINIDSLQFKNVLNDNEETEEPFNAEEKERLKKAIKALKPEEIALIELRFFENRSFKEIGEILDIKENNAKVKSHRILGKLKNILTL